MISQALAAQLLEKWNPVLEATSPIDSEETRLDTAVVLENTERQVRGNRCINEANEYGGMGVQKLGIAGFNKGTPDSGILGSGTYTDDGKNNNVLPTLIIPMVRRIFPELMAHDTVSVQPMTGPVGFAFAFRSLYGEKGQINMGWETPTDAMGEKTNANEIGYNNIYANFTGASADGAAYETSLSETAWASYTGAASEYPNAKGPRALYGTGRDTAGAEWAGVGFQNDPAYPQVGFDWLRSTVEAKTRKLGAHWSLDVQEDANAMQGIDISEEMMSTIGFELAAEIDRQLLSSQVLAAIKGGKIATWSPASADGYDQKGRLITLFTEINYLSNKIAENTRRGSANFAIASTKATSLIQTVNAEAAFQANVNGKIPSLPNTGVGSLLKVGLMNGGSQLLIRDTFARGDYMLLGYKGSQKGDTGVVYCPYIPVQMMKATDPRTFAPILGARTRYGVLSNVWGSSNYYYFLMLQGLTSTVPGVHSDNKYFAFFGQK